MKNGFLARRGLNRTPSTPCHMEGGVVEVQKKRITKSGREGHGTRGHKRNTPKKALPANCLLCRNTGCFSV